MELILYIKTIIHNILINGNFSFLLDVKEKWNLCLSDSTNFIQIFFAKCKNIPGDIDLKVRQKID